MSIPPQVQFLIAEALSEVRQHPRYHLPFFYRQALYQAFGPSVDLSGRLYTENKVLLLIPTYRRYGRLAIMSAQKVFPVWEVAIPAFLAYDRESFGMADVPQEIIATCCGLLEGTVEASLAANLLCEDFYLWRQAIGYDEVGPNAAFAADAALAALEMVLGMDIDKKGDVTLYAERAYACIGLVSSSRYHSERLKADDYLLYDFKKRLEFWEWWLTIAIPTVWEKEI